ncbi:unnamed protein product [Phytomonas sp. Hart1]|nr:unnamed protein product [Phytomonas sp. Hart1]|eukprot:CCW72060.1 unnamed protein product [Phytomonas sp. isolate Hart1]
MVPSIPKKILPLKYPVCTTVMFTLSPFFTLFDIFFSIYSTLLQRHTHTQIYIYIYMYHICSGGKSRGLKTTNISHPLLKRK